MGDRASCSAVCSDFNTFPRKFPFVFAFPLSNRHQDAAGKQDEMDAKVRELEWAYLIAMCLIKSPDISVGRSV